MSFGQNVYWSTLNGGAQGYTVLPSQFCAVGQVFARKGHQLRVLAVFTSLRWHTALDLVVQVLNDDTRLNATQPTTDDGELQA